MPNEEIELAGNGNHEMRSWLAVAGAVSATQPKATKLAYEAVYPWITGMAVAHWETGGKRNRNRGDRRRGATRGVPRMTLPDVSAELEATAKRVQELADQVAAKAKENGLSWLEGYEKVLKNLLDLEEEAAKKSGVDWATTLATAHANFVRETSEVFFQTPEQAAQELSRFTPCG